MGCNMTLFCKIQRKIHTLLVYFKENIRYEYFGQHSKIIKPMRIVGKKYIHIGNNVHILNGARIEAISKWHEQSFSPRLTIGNGTSIEQGCHIIVTDNLAIGNNCVISAYVYISDCNHQYISGKHIMETDLEIRQTSIGDNVFIGIGAKIIPGVRLGNGCVIGANSVVTHDVPEKTVVAGVPAKIIKYL